MPPTSPEQTTLLPMRYNGDSLQLLDQRKIPHETIYDEVLTTEDIWTAIKEMRVRGAPLIAVSAALGIAVALKKRVKKGEFTDAAALKQELLASCDYLMTSRPTAVNLFNCLTDIKSKVEAFDEADGVDSAMEKFAHLAEALMHEDIAANEAIMKHGAAHILEHTAGAASCKVRVMTICNTGALATSRYGTALGVVRALHYEKHLEQVYACETRPWNQGARLTVYECVQEKMPVTLICDSAVSALMRKEHIDAVIVGADRVCKNGDTANKIGTYNLAVAAKFHGVKFYVAAPSTTLDPSTLTGADVVIEERTPTEITTNMETGNRVVAEGETLSIWNPVFDVAPAELITGGIITEYGVIEPGTQAPYYDVAVFLAKQNSAS